MWVQQPDWTLVEGWIQQALELAEEGSLTQGHALAALSMNTDDESAARSALAIAERLGDHELRCTDAAQHRLIGPLGQGLRPGLHPDG